MKNAFEPIVLAACLALLALVAAGLGYVFPDIEGLTGVQNSRPEGSVPVAIKADVLQDQLAALATPQTWSVPQSGNRLFLSDRYLFYASLYPSGKYIQKDDGSARTPGGVLISWLRKFHLDISDPSIDREDPDKDGFSNRTEFFAASGPKSLPDGSKATNPIDPASHPAYLTRLRLERYEVRPFHIEFVGVVTLNGQNEFQISLTDVPPNRQPPLKKTGDNLDYEGWKIGPYTAKLVQELDKGTNTQVTNDESFLELDKPEINRKVLLPIHKIINSEESTAYFVMLMPTEIGKDIKVPRGQTFHLPMGPATEYLMVDVGDTGATIQDNVSKQTINVPKLDPAEWNEVPVPPAAAAGANSH